MHLCFSLCVAVLVYSCKAGYSLTEDEDSSLTEDEDYVTPTPDYDYTATFEYYYVTGGYHPDADENQGWDWEETPRGQAPEISHLTISVLLLGVAAACHVI